MSTELVALKHATETSAVVFYRGLSNGLLTVSCNGATHSGDTIDTAVWDGTGIVTVSGLAPGTDYPFSLYLDGVEKYAGTLKTAPGAASTFTLGWGSCAKFNRPWAGGALLGRFPDLAGFAFIGDFPYLDDTRRTPFELNGETIMDVGAAMIPDPTDQSVAQASIYAHHRFYWNMEGAKQLLRTVPCWFTCSDHDIGPGDNWDWTIAQANAYNTWATTQAQVDNMGLWCADAMRKAYWRGNPANDSANNYATYAADEQTFFAFDYGSATVIVVDHATHNLWDASGVRLGAAQTQFIKDTLAASTQPFKLIMAGSSITEYDSNLALHPPEWVSISDHITAQGITGVIVCTGDLHTPAMFNDGVIQHVRGGASGQAPHLTLPDGYTDSCRYKWQGYHSVGSPIPDRMHVAGYVTVHGSEYIEFGMITEAGDDLVTPGRIYAGTNEVTYPQVRFG